MKKEIEALLLANGIQAKDLPHAIEWLESFADSHFKHGVVRGYWLGVLTCVSTVAIILWWVTR
jgi:fructose 1,6-bisphosphatase